jgi:hypothetical protein
MRINALLGLTIHWLVEISHSFACLLPGSFPEWQMVGRVSSVRHFHCLPFSDRGFVQQTHFLAAQVSPALDLIDDSVFPYPL